MGRAKDTLSGEDGFEDFLRELIDGDHLEGAALGITKLVISKGEDSLSEKQKHVFRSQVMNEYVVDECKRCSNDIPWSEMMEAHDNGNLCGWCAHMSAKDD